MAVAPGSVKSVPHSSVIVSAPVSEIESAPGLFTLTWKLTAEPVWAVQITVLVPTGKNEPDAGLQLIAVMVSPFSPVVVWPQSPVPVGVL